MVLPGISGWSKLSLARQFALAGGVVMFIARQASGAASAGRASEVSRESSKIGVFTGSPFVVRARDRARRRPSPV